MRPQFFPLDVRDRGDHFEVRAYLSDAETKDVNVKSDGNQAIRVSISIASSRRSKRMARRRWSASSALTSNW